MYASYYGEELARLYYGEYWSPAVGTLPPEGFVIPDKPPDGYYNTEEGDMPSSLRTSPDYYEKPYVDPETYSESDFWWYAAHYGEEMARLYYGDLSPPVGSIPPEEFASYSLPVGTPVATGLSYDIRED